MRRNGLIKSRLCLKKRKNVDGNLRELPGRKIQGEQHCEPIIKPKRQDVYPIGLTIRSGELYGGVSSEEECPREE